MVFFIYLIIALVFSLALIEIFKKKLFLISITGDKHQKFASEDKVPLIGGIILFLSFLFLYKSKSISNEIIIFSLLILVLGIFSDLKILKSAFIRFLAQISIVAIYVVLDSIKISDTRVLLLDNGLTNIYFNYFFVSFCILILINGSNFIDGLNTLCIGYYLMIILIILYLKNDNQIYFDAEYFEKIYIPLLFIFFLNLFNKIFLGDSGAYLMGFIFSLSLIKIYDLNPNLSPFFIVLLFWYPCFETLFSILRKYLTKKSPMYPDTVHFHQLLYNQIKNKYKLNKYKSNLTTALMINLYNLIIFLIAANFISNSQIQILLILLNLILYTVIYFKIYLNKIKI